MTGAGLLKRSSAEWPRSGGSHEEWTMFAWTLLIAPEALMPVNISKSPDPSPWGGSAGSGVSSGRRECRGTTCSAVSDAPGVATGQNSSGSETTSDSPFGFIISILTDNALTSPNDSCLDTALERPYSPCSLHSKWLQSLDFANNTGSWVEA